MKRFFYTNVRTLITAIILVVFALTGSIVKAQTTLAAGDIIFSAYNCNGSGNSSSADTFSFILLTPISATTQISFSDRGYFGNSSWQITSASEGSVTWTAGTALPIGTEVVIAGLTARTYNPTTSTYTTNGTVVLSEGIMSYGLTLSNVGDQIIAFQGGGGSVSASGATCIAGLHYFYCTNPGSNTTTAGWDGVLCSGPNACSLPPGLTGGTNAFWSGNPGSGIYTSGRYNCTGTPFSTVAALRAAVINPANWTFLVPTGTTVGVPSGCTSYSSGPSISGHPSNKTVCINGSATFTVTASNATTYQWQENSGSGFANISAGTPFSGINTATLTINPAPASKNGYSYRCVVTNGTSVTSNSATLTVDIVSGTSSVTPVSCNGGTNGTAAVTVTSGVSSYSYSWAPSGGTGPSASGLAAGTYTCTVTDNLTCTGTVTAIVGTPSAITSSITSQTNVACNGGATGAATITASGGTGALSYNWTPGNPTGDGTASVSGLAAGTWTCTITDANSCTKTQDVTITQPATAISSSVTSQTNVACNGGATGAATITASGGTGTLSYNWTPGNPTGDGTASVSGLTAGTWTCTITDANSCTKTQNVTITQPATAISSSVTSQTNVACNGGATGAATVTASGGTGTLSYNWTPGNPTGDGTASVSGLTAGTWTCTITDANSCTKTQNVTITQPASAISSSVTSQTNVACNGGATGAATVTASGGTGTLSYNWTPGNPTGDGTASVSGLTAGTWTCTITDANSCTKTQDVTITQPATAISSSVTSQTNVACNGGATGAATITASGGTGTLSYNWTPGNPTGDGTASVSGLTAGTWTCTITDANSCTKTQNVTITQPTAITSSVTSQTNVACNGGATGAATITASGGTGTLSYNWTPGNPTGDGTASVSGLTAGTWTCTITDANSCTKTQDVTITQPTAITSSVTSQTNVACNGGATGAATITASGGTGTLSYNWTPGNPTGDGTASVSGLTAGTWTCTITDANSCTKTQNVTITQPTAITSSVTSQTNVACNGGATGAATVTASGGTGTLSYNWTPGNPTGDGTVSVSGLTAGTWTCTITDANSCTKTQNVTITQPTAITSSVTSQTNVACNGGATGAATITASGGTGTLSYNWTPGNPTGDGTASVSGLTAGIWTCTITDANSCTKAQNVTITQPATAVSVVVSNDTNICASSSVNINAAASGGTSGYTYIWQPGNLNGATQSVAPSTTTNYIVTASDANGCTKNDTVKVSVGATLAQSDLSNDISISGQGNSTSNALVGNITFLYDNQCKIVASVKQNAALGTISGQVTVIDTVPQYQGRPFVPRWYQVTPQNNVPGNVNLYFTQQDFDDYNVYATSHSLPKLPQSPTDQPGIDSLVVTKVSGGDFNSGTGAFTLIHPDSVKWNATLHFWTVSLTVPSFSQFLIHANNAADAPLYVNFSSFIAKKENGAAVLYWTTERESENTGFEIQRSSDGKIFQTVGVVASKAKDGNSNSTLSYSFYDKTPFTGMNFYRLAEKDRQGHITYSDIRTINFDGKSNFNCYPNPVQHLLTVEYSSDKAQQMNIRITDIVGKIVKEQNISFQKGFNKSNIDMSGLGQGIYNVTIISDAGLVYTSKVVKN